MSYDSKGTVNKVILVGRLGSNPELRATASGSMVANFSLATTTSRKGQDGNLQELVEWHRVVVFGKTAENISKYTAKGSRVYIEGRLQTRSWDDKEGVKRYTTEVVVDQVQFLDSAKKSASEYPADSKPSEQPAEPPTVDEDDLPF